MKRKYLFLVVILLALAASWAFSYKNSVTGLVAHDVFVVEQTPIAPASQESLDQLRSTVNQLQQKVNDLQTSADKNEQELSRLNGNYQGLNSQINQLQQSLGGRIDSVSTGLAGVQQTVVSTQEELSDLQEGSSSNKKMLTAFIIILAMVICGIGAYFFYSWSKKGPKNHELYYPPYQNGAKIFLHQAEIDRGRLAG